MNMANNSSEYSEGGSRIYRYKSAPERDLRFPGSDAEAIQALEEHIETFVPGEGFVFHEIVSDKIHLDVHIRYPVPGRDYYVLITTGMSDLPMTVPPEVPECRYAELMICLPASWRLSEEDLKDQKNYWPIWWLKFLARFPHDFNTWLWMGHTLPNGDPARPLAPGVGFTGVLIAPPVTFADGFGTVNVRDGKTVKILAVLPVYNDELDCKLTKGVNALLDLFDSNNISEVLEPNRPSVITPNVIKKKRFFGLFG